ncbi:copia protein [Tanacetum coccineum]|uniref:Copia protein n=1 Tax=Tanacetum coccineum TaxID=301880 RepID=A0ABQ5A826_9ASTR
MRFILANESMFCSFLMLTSLMESNKSRRVRKSLALKAKKESSDEECSTSGSKDEEYAMTARDFKKFIKRRVECPNLPKDKNQRAFVGGSWSNSGEEDDQKANDKTCLVAQASSETLPLVDDDLDEEGAIKVTEKKNLENDIEDETLEIDDVLVPQPKNLTIIGTKWVYRNKLDENGVVSQNKARLVAQSCNQQEGIDYDETYAPVTCLESIRILLDYACALDFKLFQLDIKSAFLNGFINEEVYVAQPLRFIDYEKPDHVYKLKKALCGLKQAPKACLLYLKASRPDIMFSVCLCACFKEDPKTSHLEAVKRVFRYIKGTTHLGLWYPKGTGIETVVYADSDHTGDYADQKALEILYVHRMLSNIMVLEETNRS